MEADGPPSEYGQKINSSLKPRHDACVVHLTSSHCAGILLSDIITKGQVHYNKVFEERYHIYITVIAVCCYSCSYLSLFVFYCA